MWYANHLFEAISEKDVLFMDTLPQLGRRNNPSLITDKKELSRLFMYYHRRNLIWSQQYGHWSLVRSVFITMIGELEGKNHRSRTYFFFRGDLESYGAPYWTLLRTFLIYAQLQIYLLNFTLSILIAIFSCQIPSTYAMFYKKGSCVFIQYGQLYIPYGMMHRASGFCKIAPRPLLAIFAEAKNGGSMLYSRLRE